MIRCDAVLRTTAVLLGLASYAHANPATLVPTTIGPDEPGYVVVSLDYAYTLDSANIQREAVGPGQDPLGGIGRLDDLRFEQARHTLTPKLEIGLLPDSWLAIALPIVIGQTRELALDGITRADSSTIRDGLLTGDGFDARDPGTALPGSDELLFRGASRSGLDQVHLGLGFALMNPHRDPTKPLWKLGADLRLAVGKVMRFDAMNTAEETGVSRGVHELALWTTFARRYDRVAGYFDVFWRVPLTARESSLFDDIDQRPGAFGATNTLPGQQGGITFGIEAFALDDRTNHNSVSVDVSARAVGHFEGRDYSEIWEVFALAGDVRRDGVLAIDRDPTVAGMQAVSHPGITNIENYLETAARLGLRGRLGKRVHFGVSVDLAWKTDHAITFADAGVDLPTCTGGGTPGRDCEDESNELVTQGTAEVNPLHVPRIDLVGHRYLAVDNFTLSVGVQAAAQF